MKRRVALGALVVLAGVVSLGALLMWGPVDNAPSASATYINPLIVKTGPHPVWDGDTCDDCEVVGDVYLNLCGATLQVVFTPTTANMLDEVHACVAIGDTLPDWLPPGNRDKCVEAGGHFGAADCDAGICHLDIPANSGLECEADVYVRAHAATADGPTAWGEEWKRDYEAKISCCSELCLDLEP